MTLKVAAMGGAAALFLALGTTPGVAVSAGETALARAAAAPYPAESYAQAPISDVRPGVGRPARAPGAVPGARSAGPASGPGGPGFGRGPGPGPGYGYYRRGPSGGAVAAGVIGGLAAGAIVGGAIASQPGPGYYGYDYGPPPPVAYGGPPPYGPAAPVGNVYGRDPRWVSYCASRYPNFDPVSGTYIASDGYRYPCE